jgi:NAD(P)-dependent dehydrogenase (short-subunit alcohol dehydrogenase family)
MTMHGKTVLITGASRGLGRALALAFARKGARLALVARGRRALEEVAAEARRAGATEVVALAADVGEKEAIHRIAGEAQALVGPIDVLVHDASTLGPTPLVLLLDTACEDLTRTLEVNVVGSFRLTKAIAGPMVLRGAGVIVHVSSDAAVEAYPRWGAYGVSKAALDHLARSFAVELEGTGVRVLTVDPGEMDTAMHRAAVPDADPRTLADPADVAAAILELLEDEARAPHGARVRVEVPGGAS